MKSGKVIIQEIYWERVQFYVKGYGIDVNLESAKPNLINFTESQTFEPHNIEIDGNHFIYRFNVNIINNGSYLPQDNYLLVLRDEYNVVAQLSTDFFDVNHYSLEEQQYINYKRLDNDISKKNYLLNQHEKTFRKSGTSKNNVYKLKPEISREVNELIFKVTYKKPKPKRSQFKKIKIKFRKTYNKFTFSVRDLLFNLIFNVSKKVNNKSKRTVLFTSDSRDEFSGNFKFVYDKMKELGLNKQFKIQSVLKKHVSARRSLKDKIKFPYLLGKAKYIFIDDYHPMLANLKFRKEQQILQLWHAVGAFKTVGFSRAGKRGGMFFNENTHRYYTKAYVSSEHDVSLYAEGFGITEDKVIPTGIPRTDIFFDESYAQKTIKEMREKIPQINDKNVVLYAPTFRGNGHRTAHYPFFKIDFDRLAKYCSDTNSVILFKIHPLVRNKLTIPEKYKHYLIDISSYREVNDILFVTDVLISDYSSLIYEYATFLKPMLFFAFDLEHYTYTRGFYEEYTEFVPGKIVRDFNSLIDSLYEEDYDVQKVKPFLHKHFKYTDGKSSERVVKEVFDIQKV